MSNARSVAQEEYAKKSRPNENCGGQYNRDSAQQEHVFPIRFIPDPAIAVRDAECAGF